VPVKIDTGQVIVRHGRVLVMAADTELPALERLLSAVHKAHAVGMMRVSRRFDDYADSSGSEGHIPGLIGDVDVADDLGSGR